MGSCVFHRIPHARDPLGGFLDTITMLTKLLANPNPCCFPSILACSNLWIYAPVSLKAWTSEDGGKLGYLERPQGVKG